MNTGKGKKMKFQKGFTLVEIAIVLMIMGVIVAAVMPVYMLYLKDTAERETIDNQDYIMDKIATYLAVHGRYPCPAAPANSREDAEYGHESPECSASVKSVTTGTCDSSTGTNISGLCVEDSPRAATPNPRIIIGTLPFRELQMDEDLAFDGYGNQFTYAVTENLANPDTFRVDAGGIKIEDLSGNAVTYQEDDPMTSPEDESIASHYILFSHGENGYGAYNKNGVRLDCSLASATEAENCVSNAGNGTFRVALKSSNLGSADEYDDIVISFTPSEMPYWRLTDPDNTEDIQILAQDSLVGVKNKNPYTNPPGQELDVGSEFKGIVRAQNELQTSSLCSYDNDAECFESRKIANNDAMMECPSGYLRKIDHGQFVCGPVETKCPEHFFLIGINADGSIQCSPKQPKNCPATQVKLCSHDPDVTVPAGVHGSYSAWIYSASLAGNQRHKRWHCNNGTWESGTGWWWERGVCSCTSAVLSTTPGNACGLCQNGTYTKTTQRVCPSNTITTTSNTSTCSCDPLTPCRRVVPKPCPTGWVPDDPTNPPKKYQEFVCTPSGTPVGFDPTWHDLPSSGFCVCNNLSPIENTKLCSTYKANFRAKSGEVGIPEIKLYDCTATPPAYGAWQVDTSKTPAGVVTYEDAFNYYCECDDAAPPKDATKNCSDFNTATEKYIGTIPLEQIWDCHTLAYGTAQYLAVDSALTEGEIKAKYCTYVPPMVCTWKPDVSTGYGPTTLITGHELGTADAYCDCSTEINESDKCYKMNNTGTAATMYSSCICTASSI